MPDFEPRGRLSAWSVVALLLAAVWIVCTVLLIVGAFTGKDC